MKSDRQNNLVTFPKLESQSLAALPAELDALLNSDLKRSELKIQILELSQKFRVADKEIWNLYQDKEREPEQAETQEDAACLCSQTTSFQIRQPKNFGNFTENLS